MRERNLFITGTYMQNILNGFGERLGFVPTYGNFLLITILLFTNLTKFSFL